MNEYQKQMVQNFMRNQVWSKDSKNGYQTPLSSEEESQFRDWTNKNKERLGVWSPDDPFSDYDYRGYWKEQQGSKAPEGHFPDTYKTPYHETFSNESVYANPDAPSWEQKDNSWILKDKFGNVIKQE